MKVSTLSVIALALLSVAPVAAAESRIGFVNSDRLMREAESNVATVTTSRRLLIFRTPTGSWEIRLR